MPTAEPAVIQRDSGFCASGRSAGSAPASSGRSAGSAPARLRLDIAYDGTDFHGWARQPGLRTVCGVLEDSLSTVLREPVQLTVAGRTDAGVHAEGQVAHLDVPNPPEDPVKLVRRMARFLPADVRILQIAQVSAEFDARFSAIRRHYRYRLSTADYGAPPLEARSVVAWNRPLDLDAMRLVSQRLLGLHNFAAFCRRREGATTVRDLQRFDWIQRDEYLTAHVSADAFCWSMVRSLVGAVLAVGEGRRTLESITKLLTERERSSSITVAPAHGLSLVAVDYPSPSEFAARNAETRSIRPEMSDDQACCDG